MSQWGVSSFVLGQSEVCSWWESPRSVLRKFLTKELARDWLGDADWDHRMLTGQISSDVDWYKVLWINWHKSLRVIGRVCWLDFFHPTWTGWMHCGYKVNCDWSSMLTGPFSSDVDWLNALWINWKIKLIVIGRVCWLGLVGYAD